MAVITGFVIDPFTIRTRNIHFIGLTSPRESPDRVLSALARLNTRVQAMNVKFTVINTDGWIDGDCATRFKVLMAETVHPSAVVGIQSGSELEHILSPLEGAGYRVIRVQTPQIVKKRDQEERSRLREQGYRKYLKGGKLRILPMSWVDFRFTSLGSGKILSPDRTSELEKELKCRIVYAEEGSDKLTLVVDDKSGMDEAGLDAWKRSVKKGVSLNVVGDERNLLVGLLDSNDEFCGLGVLHDIDFSRRALRIHTPYNGRIAAVELGRIKVTKYGREIGATDVFST
jgi:polynucleotide 5'-kinase involved in rRNA processing